MIQLIVSLGLGLLSLIALLVFSVAKSTGDANPVQKLPAGSRPEGHDHSEVLFSRNDYDKLLATQELRPVARQYLRERRRLLLTWLDEQRGDVHGSWEFHRFMVRYGLPVTFRQEVATGLLGLSAVLYLTFARTVVLIFGPFSLIPVVVRARVPVERLSKRGATLLFEAPPETKSRIERDWSNRVAALQMQ